MKIILSICVGLTLLVCCSVAGSGAAGNDKVKITRIAVEEPVTRGVEIEFTVEVEYKLDSADEGEINLGFNTDRPKAFKLVARSIVQKGKGTATLKARVIPVDWGRRGRFSAMVNLSKHPHEMRWQPLAGDKQDITVRQ
jgi:hypothetical protein